jgi:hypothetical protein
MLTDLDQPLNVIGNAESIFTKTNGNIIDSLPTIRFNRANIINEQSQGSRWDFLASSEVNTFEKYNSEKPKFHTLIFTPTKKELEYKIRKAKFKAKRIMLPLFQSQWLENNLNAPPSTGLQVLYYLSEANNKQVNIFGFDFKETKTFYETRNKGQHDYQKEKSFILNLVDKNGWKIYR